MGFFADIQKCMRYTYSSNTILVCQVAIGSSSLRLEDKEANMVAVAASTGLPFMIARLITPDPLQETKGSEPLLRE